MIKNFDTIRIQIAEALLGASSRFNGSPVAGLTALQLAEALVEPPNTDMGDLAFGCFPLAKALKKGPPMIAQGLIKDLAVPDFVKTVEAVGPYINFRIKPEGFGQHLLSSIIQGDFFKVPYLQDAPKVMIEFCQPNTHKELHVGHMRNACLGDALVRTMRAVNYPVVSSTFPGDMGTHVAKCLWYLKFHNQEPEPATDKGEWIGRMYSKGHLKLEDERGTSKEDENRQQLTLILKQLESGNGEFFDLWKKTRQWSIDLMNSVYTWADIKFDQWYWESEMDTPSVEFVKELYQEGKLVKSDGAIGMDLNEDKLGFCLLLKTDGTGLYATKDLELARRKFQDFNIQKNIYVVDMRQALHFQQVFKVLDKLGFEQAKDCYHLQYSYVELPDGAMSSRKGNIIPLLQLVNGMEAMVKEKYLSRYQGEWSKEEVNLVAKQVAQGAIKYGMVKIDSNKKIVFEMEEWLKLDGDSGPFIQYSAARINSLVRKLGPVDIKANWSLLVHPAEHKVMQSLLFFRSTILAAGEQMKPSFICTYLLDLAKRFNHFYHECSINNAETEDLKKARLALSQAVGETLKRGLETIGIPTPERM